MAPDKHAVRAVTFLGRSVHTVLNEQGAVPSALVALANVLLLRNSLQLRARADITRSELLSLVAAKLLESSADAQKAPNRGGGGGAAGLSTTDAVALLPGLEAAGGSVTACDVRFTRVHDFAYAPQPHAVFELLDVLLVHAWVVDAADLATRGVVGNRSYSQVLARATELEAEGSDAAKAEAALLRSFLGSSSGGMTVAGLAALLAQVPDRQLCVLYCGGAYRAAFKREDVLYLLIDDAAAAAPPGDAGPGASTAVWERLDAVGAPTVTVSAAFQDITRPDGTPMQRPPVRYTADSGALALATPAAAAAPAASAEVSEAAGRAPSVSPIPPPMAQPTVVPLTAAALAALSMGQSAGGAGGGPSTGAPEGGNSAAVARDHALALRLQESYEEQERAARRAVRQAAARLQQQQAKGAGGEDASDVRDFVNRVEQHVGGSCTVQ